LQGFVNVSCGNGGMASCNRNLMEIRNDVAGGVDPIHCGTLMRINLHAPHIVCLRAQSGRKVGSDTASKCRVDDLEASTFADSRPDFGPLRWMARTGPAAFMPASDREFMISSFATGGPSTLSNVTSFE
jgi:hypothetical protein